MVLDSFRIMEKLLKIALTLLILFSRVQHSSDSSSMKKNKVFEALLCTGFEYKHINSKQSHAPIGILPHMHGLSQKHSTPSCCLCLAVAAQMSFVSFSLTPSFGCFVVCTTLCTVLAPCTVHCALLLFAMCTA